MGRYNMRFRRSIGFGKFFRLNFGKRGMSASAGVPGARRTWHMSGRRTTTFGLPGTGISWTKIDSPNERPPAAGQVVRKEPSDTNTRSGPSDLDLILGARDELEARERDS